MQKLLSMGGCKKFIRMQAKAEGKAARRGDKAAGGRARGREGERVRSYAKIRNLQEISI